MPDESRTRMPSLVVHSDWSTSPQKRCQAQAAWNVSRYVIDAPAFVGPLNQFFPDLLHAFPNRKILAGFDFPIGVPAPYAALAGIVDFLPVLPQFGANLWPDFYTIATTQGEISLQRPFYPFAPGGKTVAHLIAGLGVNSAAALLRRCDTSVGRPAACKLFWTLGANQVGRAAISGWRDLLATTIRDALPISVWPFEGSYDDLLANDRRIIIAETYPAEGYGHLGFPQGGWSKRKQQDRLARGNQITAWAQRRGVSLSPALQQTLATGFGPNADGEDPFDAVVGLCSMLEVVLHHRGDGVANNNAPLPIEGWIFGQQP